MPPKTRLQGLLFQEQEPITPEEAAAGLLARVPVIGPMLGETVSPPQLNQGSTLFDPQTGLRTLPLQAQEIFELLKRGGPKESFIDYTRRTQEGVPSEFFDLSQAQPALLDPPQVQRYSPTARADVSRATDLLSNRRVTSQAKKYAQKGMEMMPERWYATSPLYELYVEELGPEKGREKFIRDIDILAGTSPRSKIPQNIRTASLYQYMAEQGMDLPESTKKMSEGYSVDEIFPPKGYGSIAQGTHLGNVKKILSGEGMDPKKNPKPLSFSANLQGNESVITADTHYVRMLGMLSQDPRFLAESAEVGRENKKGEMVYEKINPKQMFKDGELTIKEALKNPTYWESAPTKPEYEALEKVGLKLAKQLGVTPARFQEAVWVGAGDLTGLQSPPEPFLRTLENRVKYTAEQFGADPEMVLRQYIRGEIPLAQMQDMQEQYGGLLS